jgi:hypothetical protein
VLKLNLLVKELDKLFKLDLKVQIQFVSKKTNQSTHGPTLLHQLIKITKIVKTNL